jgi:hypothetical protein
MSLRPSVDGKALIAHLYNPSSRPADAVLSLDPDAKGAAFRSDPFEDRLEKIVGPLRLAAFETVTLRIER